MLESPNAGNFLLGNGEIYFAEVDADGVNQGERHVGNCTQFAISTDANFLDKYSRMSSNRGLLKRRATRKTVTVAITGDEMTSANLAVLLLGDDVEFTQAGGTITDEALTPTAWSFGLWYPLANRQLSSVTVESDPGGGFVALTEGDDYELDLVLGRIKLLSTGAAGEGDPVQVSYTAAAIASKRSVRGANQTAIERFVRFVGDPSEGPTWDAELWRVNFAPNGELALIQDGEDYGAWQLTGTLIEDTTNHPNEPFYRLVER